MNLTRLAARLPGLHSLVNQIADTIVIDRRSVIVLVPDSMAVSDLWYQIHSTSGGRGYEIAARLMPSADRPLIDLLWERQHGSSDMLPSLPRLMELLDARSSAHDTVFTIAQIDTLPPDQIARCMSLCAEWASLAQQRSTMGRSTATLCLIAQASPLLPCLPSSNTLLDVIWWAGFPSVLEHQMLCRMTEGQISDIPLRLWREYLLPEIAGADSSLLERLLHQSESHLTPALDEEPILHVLEEVAAERGWEAIDGEAALTLHANTRDMGSGLHAQPRAQQEAWARGWLGYTPEQGWHLHSALLAAIGRHDDVRQRLWRGQARLLLPMVDQVRLECCNALTRHYGADWASRWVDSSLNDKRNTVAASPYEVELSELSFLLFNFRERTARMNPAWIHVIRRAWTIRNDISHLKLVSFADFQMLWRLWQSI